MPLLNWERVGRDDPNFKTCLVVTTAAGFGIGSMTGLGVFSVPLGFGGALWGLAGGYFACPYLVPALRRKIEDGLPLSDFEARSATEALGKHAGLSDARDGVKLLSLIRRSTSTALTAATPDSRPPKALAQQLLSCA